MTDRYRLTMLAYPKEYRAEHGGELVETANELADDRWSSRQAASLLAGGLRTRARLAAADTSTGLWTDGVGLALVLWLVLRSVPSLTFALGATGDIGAWRPSLPTTIAIAVFPAFVLTLTTRWPAALAVTASGLIAATSQFLEGPIDPIGHQMVALTLLQAASVTGLAWWLAIVGDGRRAIAPRTAGLALVALVGSAYLSGSPDAVVAHAVILLGLPVAGVALAALDPRPVIAATTVWFILLLTLVPTRLILIPELDGGTLVIALVILSVVAVALLLSRFGTRRLLADVRT